MERPLILIIVFAFVSLFLDDYVGTFYKIKIPFLFTFLTIILCFMVYFSKKKYIYPFFYSSIISFIIISLIKIVFKRPRPDLIISSSNYLMNYSFPSLEASIFLAGFFFLRKTYVKKQKFILILMIIILLVKIYQGRSYFSDIYFGGCIGYLTAYMIYKNVYA